MSLVFDPSNPHFFRDIDSQFPFWDKVIVGVDSRGKVYLERPSWSQALCKLVACCFRKSYNVHHNLAHVAALATKKIQAHDDEECLYAIAVIDKLARSSFESLTLREKRKELVIAASIERALPPALLACQSGFFGIAGELIDQWSNRYAPYASLLLRASCQTQKFSRALFFARQGGGLNNVPEYILPLFHTALEQGDEDSALRCMSMGVDITCPTKNNRPPLMISIERKLSRVSLDLIQRGVCLDSLDEEGRNYFHLVARHNMVDVMRLLINRHSLGFDDIDQNGMTPFMIASGAGNLEIMNILRSAGVDVARVNHQGKTAFRLALESAKWKGQKEHMLQVMSHFFPKNSACYMWLQKAGPGVFISHVRDFFHALIMKQKRDSGCNCLEAAFLLGDTELADEITNYLSAQEYRAVCLDLEKRYPQQASLFLFFSKYRLGARFHVGTLYQARAEFRENSNESISELLDLFDDLEFKDGWNERFVNLPEMASHVGLDQSDPECFKKELEAFISRIDKKKSSSDEPWNVNNQKRFYGSLKAAIRVMIEKIQDAANPYIATSMTQVLIEQCLLSRDTGIGALYNNIMIAWNEIVGHKDFSIQDRLDITLAEYREKIFHEMIDDAKKFLLNEVDMDRPTSVFTSAFAEEFRLPAAHLRHCVTPFDAIIDRKKVIDTFYLNYTPKAIVEEAVMPLLQEDETANERFRAFLGSYAEPLTADHIAEGLVRMGILKSRFSS